MESGASEGIRTLDIHLGKVTLYQTELRSHPKVEDQFNKTIRNGKRIILPSDRGVLAPQRSVRSDARDPKDARDCAYDNECGLWTRTIF